MAITGEFHLYVKKPPGKKPQGTPLVVVVADFFPDFGEPEYVELVRDPFADQEWYGENLKVLQSTLAPLIEARQTQVESDVLNELRKPAFESWMEPLMSTRCSEDKRLSMLTGLMEMVGRALTTDGTVIYFAH